MSLFGSSRVIFPFHTTVTAHLTSPETQTSQRGSAGVLFAFHSALALSSPSLPLHTPRRAKEARLVFFLLSTQPLSLALFLRTHRRVLLACLVFLYFPHTSLLALPLHTPRGALLARLAFFLLFMQPSSLALPLHTHSRVLLAHLVFFCFPHSQTSQHGSSGVINACLTSPHTQMSLNWLVWCSFCFPHIPRRSPYLSIHTQMSLIGSSGVLLLSMQPTGVVNARLTSPHTPHRSLPYLFTHTDEP